MLKMIVNPAAKGLTIGRTYDLASGALVWEKSVG
jgi:hypothetical protein